MAEPMDDAQWAKTKYQCRLTFATGEYDAETKMTANRPRGRAGAQAPLMDNLG